MLFSRDDVAQFINRCFEPVWESVRPVPTVRIDFGNGTVLTRTLHGNIATSVCADDGQLLDVLPGIYDPAMYLARLDQFRLLVNYVDQAGRTVRDARLREYHEGQVAALRNNEAPPRFVNRADMSKRVVEGGVLAVLVKSPADLPRVAARAEGAARQAGNDLGDWEMLRQDTAINETARRRQVHEHLALGGPTRPEGATKWLYKEVLHADLDDPYLGLGHVLFDHYVFEKEDRRN